jgi:hypothetical protein
MRVAYIDQIIGSASDGGLHDAPLTIDEISSRKPQVSQRIIGEIMHKVLGWWQFQEDYHDLMTSWTATHGNGRCG